MPNISIKNGSTGDVATVDQNNRLYTRSLTETEDTHACESGIAQKFNINTGDITLTSAAKTSVLYFKNNSDYDYVITAFIYNLGNTTGGSGDVLIEVVRNPTAGGIITNANNVAIGTGTEANQNFGSLNFLSALIYKGASGETAVSGGSTSVTTRSASNTGRIIVSLGALFIPKGTSVAVDYTPPTSNTSQICQFAFAGYLRNSKVSAEGI